MLDYFFIGLHFGVLYQPNIRERIRMITAHFWLRIKCIRTYSLKRKIVKEFFRKKKGNRKWKIERKKIGHLISYKCVTLIVGVLLMKISQCTI